MSFNCKAKIHLQELSRIAQQCSECVGFLHCSSVMKCRLLLLSKPKFLTLIKFSNQWQSPQSFTVFTIIAIVPFFILYFFFCLLHYFFSVSQLGKLLFWRWFIRIEDNFVQCKTRLYSLLSTMSTCQFSLLDATFFLVYYLGNYKMIIE